MPTLGEIVCLQPANIYSRRSFGFLRHHLADKFRPIRRGRSPAIHEHENPLLRLSLLKTSLP
jgi:hypothetical protein